MMCFDVLNFIFFVFYSRILLDNYWHIFSASTPVSQIPHYVSNISTNRNEMCKCLREFVQSVWCFYKILTKAEFDKKKWFNENTRRGNCTKISSEESRSHKPPLERIKELRTDTIKLVVTFLAAVQTRLERKSKK